MATPEPSRRHSALINDTAPSIKKSRNRNTLLDSQQQKKYLKPTQKDGGWHISRAVDVAYRKTINNFTRAKTASIEAAKTWNGVRNIEHIGTFPVHEELIGNYANHYIDRRICIKYLYIAIFGAPPQDMWHEMKLIPAISGILDIPVNSHTAVRAVLEEIVQNVPAYNGDINRGGGRKAMIEHGTVQADIVYRGLAQNLTARDVTQVLNMFREANNETLISRSAVQGFIKRSDCIKTRKRQLKKSGRENPDCVWAISRLAQAEQWREQFRVEIGVAMLHLHDREGQQFQLTIPIV